MSTTGESDVAALREEIADLKSVIEEQASRIDLLLNERAQDRQRIAELEDYRAENERDKASIRQQVTEVEQPRSTADAESDESQAESASRLTPMHQLIQAGEAGVIGHVTASIRRAKAMAEHFQKWASKAPKGLVVRENLKTLLETATGEDLAWKQVYRAGHALAKFSKGTIAFKKTRRYGWILIAQPDDCRLRPLSASGG